MLKIISGHTSCTCIIKEFHAKDGMKNWSKGEGEGNKVNCWWTSICIPLFCGFNGRSVTNLYHSTVLNENDIFPWNNYKWNVVSKISHDKNMALCARWHKGEMRIGKIDKDDMYYVSCKSIIVYTGVLRKHMAYKLRN